MARKSKSQHSATLIDALRFVGMNGAEYCSISNNLVTSVTDNICMGHPIEENLEAQANIKSLTQSLCKVNEQATITQLDIDKLHVSSDGLQVYVNCEQQIKHVKQDEATSVLNMEFINALNHLKLVVSNNGEHIAMKSLLFYAQSIYSTNRYMMVEYWHGLDLPFVVIDKKLCDLILKCKKETVNFGCSTNSVSIYFKDDSWIMGKNYQDEWPNPFAILDGERNYQDISIEFQKALRLVPGFNGAKLAYVVSGRLQSEPEEKAGASYPISGLADGGIYGTKDLVFLLKFGKKIDCTNPKMIYFIGDRIRGAISSRVN